MKLLKKFIKIYLVAAFIHSFAKIAAFIQKLNKAKEYWKKLPGRDPDISGSDIKKSFPKIHDFLVEDALKEPTKDIYKLPLPHPALLCFSGKAVKWMLKDEFEHITKEGRDFLPNVLMNGLLGTPSNVFSLRHGPNFHKEQTRWTKQRKMIASVLSRNIFKNHFIKSYEEVSLRLIKELNSSLGTPVNIQEHFFNYTLDSTEKNFFGRSSRERSNFHSLFTSSQLIMARILVTALPVVQIIKTLLPFPFGTISNHSGIHKYSSLGTLFYFTFNKDFKQFESNNTRLQREVDAYIHSIATDNTVREREDVLSKLLSQPEEDINHKEIRGLVLSMFSAGRDATATTLSWTVFELTQNPKVQKKLYEEISKKLNGKIPEYDDLADASLPYLNALYYEVLRLHPPLSTDQKVTTKDLHYVDGTFIPKGTLLLYSPYGMGRNSSVYPSPEKFDPERWIPFKAPDEFEFPVFQGGPRNCLGKDLAKFKIKYFVVRLVQSFKFSLKEGEAEKIGYGIGLTASVSNCKDRKTNELLVISEAR